MTMATANYFEQAAMAEVIDAEHRRKLKKLGFKHLYQDSYIYERPTQPELPPEPTSRLGARCTRCDHESPRVDFMWPRRGYPDLFDDQCPRCRSDNVEVFDPNHRRL
jgi:hypothetical protein